MSSLTRRYLDGEWEPVWHEIRALGSIPTHLESDVDGVAHATMSRVRAHVDRLAEAYVAAGLVVRDIPVRKPTTADDVADLARLSTEIGHLPAALRFCLTEVGGLWLAGDCAPLGLYYEERAPELPSPNYPDPLVLPDVEYLRYEWDEHTEEREEEDEDEFWFSFAPDELHKANVSGATHDIHLPQSVADPAVEGVCQHKGDLTLIEYLRWSISWGGCPGWSLAPGQIPPQLEMLRVTPDF